MERRALYLIIKKHVVRELGLNHETNNWSELKADEQTLVKVPFHEYIWGDIIGSDGRMKAEIDGYLNPDNKYEYKTVDYRSLPYFITNLYLSEVWCRYQKTELWNCAYL